VVFGGWATTGEAGGRTDIALPRTLASGWYEIRLWSGDWNVYTPLARSEPIRISDVLDLPGGGGQTGGGSSVMPFSGSGGGGAVNGWLLALAALVMLGRRVVARARSVPA
jgi:hypothetical protein